MRLPLQQLPEMGQGNLCPITQNANDGPIIGCLAQTMDANRGRGHILLDLLRDDIWQPVTHQPPCQIAHLAHGGCISLQWTWLGWQFVFDQDKLFKILESSLDETAVKRDSRKFWTVATQYASGSGVLFDGTNDLFRALRVTTSVPGICAPILIDGEEHGDGAPGLRMHQAVRKLWAKRVLVIANRYTLEERWIVERTLTPFLTYLTLFSAPSGVRSSAMGMESVFAEEMTRIEACTRIKKLFIYPSQDDPYLWPWSNDVPELARAMHHAQRYTEELIDRAHL